MGSVAADGRAGADDFALRVAERLEVLLGQRLGTERLSGSRAAVIEAVSGGKMLRPRAAWFVANAYGSPDDESLVRAGVALELLHAASLVHDDIIDASLTRRGRPTIHVLTDSSTATLVGDLLVGLAFEEASRSEPAVSSALASAFTSLCLGQLSEASLEWGPGAVPQIEEYARLKTGALFGAAFTAGALSSGIRPDDLPSFRAAGESLGVAFQFADDLLDVRDGDADGKDSGVDLRNGIPTLPIWHAFHSLGGGEGEERPAREQLAAAIASPEGTELTLRRVAHFVDATRLALPAAARPDLLSAVVEVTLVALTAHDWALMARPRP